MDWMCSWYLPNDEDAWRYTNHQYINSHSQSQIAVSAMKVDLTWTFGFLADTDGALANVTATGLWNCNTKCHQVIHDHIKARSDAKASCFAAISQLYSWLHTLQKSSTVATIMANNAPLWQMTLPEYKRTLFTQRKSKHWSRSMGRISWQPSHTWTSWKTIMQCF